jgi:hypothetical protein
VPDRARAKSEIGYLASGQPSAVSIASNIFNTAASISGMIVG